VKLYFITGASGFVGRRLIKALKGEIRVLSRSRQPNYDTVVCDFQSDSIPKDSLSGVDTVFHLAGFAHDTGDESKNIDLYQKVNVEATVELAKLAIKSGVKKFIFISSVKAGCTGISGCCGNEEDQGDPVSIYGKTKREAELKLLEMSRNSKMHLSIIRPALIYGPNVKGNLKLMLLGIRKGWFPPLPKTGNKRSMIHVDDLIRAILLVTNDIKKNGEIFIATDGIFYSSDEIYKTIRNIEGKSVARWTVPKIFFDLIGLISPSIKYKINKLLGDECYSSQKLEALGFSAKKTLRDMNETDF
tara:strand:- start:1353 stop:2258 length:906 start_codon:yes stop_codon:yes gene_type:complete